MKHERRTIRKKITSENLNLLLCRKKRTEIRKDDFDCEIGDILEFEVNGQLCATFNVRFVQHITPEQCREWLGSECPTGLQLIEF